MKSLSRSSYAMIAVALSVVLFLAVNIVANAWLGTARLDLPQSLQEAPGGSQATPRI